MPTLLSRSRKVFRESNNKVFVAYFDVSKAFDSMWMDGFFYQLHKLGVKHSLWRMLYKVYLNFTCCVRIGNLTSTWYDMDCGIHQGGFLSLMNLDLEFCFSSHLCQMWLIRD